MEKRGRKPRFWIIVILLLIVTSTTAAATTRVSIEDVTIGEGETASVPILISDVTGVKGAHILLEYDSTKVHVLDIGNSDFAMETHKEIDNATGYVRYTVFSLTALNGDVKFADVTLEGMNPGESPLNLTVVALNDGVDEIVRDVTNGTFTVTEAPPAAISTPKFGASPETMPTVTVTPTTTSTISPLVTPTSTSTPAATPIPKPGIPGFEAVFAITGLLAVAYRVLIGKRK